MKFFKLDNLSEGDLVIIDRGGIMLLAKNRNTYVPEVNLPIFIYAKYGHRLGESLEIYNQAFEFDGAVFKGDHLLKLHPEFIKNKESSMVKPKTKKKKNDSK